MKSRQRRILDVYAVLGAERSATWAELRRRYRARARELHPDVQAHRPSPSRLDQARANELFSRLQQAWSMVATPERRAAYDLALSDAPQPARKSSRPAQVPRWSAGPFAGALLRTGPGNLHIALPGGDWDLSLKRFLEEAERRRETPLLIGDLPPHLSLRQALEAACFVERLRLTTMVGLEPPAEERLGEDPDDDGEWKLVQLGAAFQRWAQAFPELRRQLPYAEDLRFMGRLSVAGFQINLPHAAGLYELVECPPSDRTEARRRSALAVLDLHLPPLQLALLAAFAEDRVAISALAEGWPGLARLAQLGASELGAAQRALESRRGRRDGQEPLPGSALDHEPYPAALEPLLEALPLTSQFLRREGRVPSPLPWGAPLSQSGFDRRLSDAAARLLGRLLEAVLDRGPRGLELVAMRGQRIRFRTGADPAPVRIEISEVVEDACTELLGFPLRPTFGKG